MVWKQVQEAHSSVPLGAGLRLELNVLRWALQRTAAAALPSRAVLFLLACFLFKSEETDLGAVRLFRDSIQLARI